MDQRPLPYCLFSSEEKFLSVCGSIYVAQYTSNLPVCFRWFFVVRVFGGKRNRGWLIFMRDILASPSYPCDAWRRLFLSRGFITGQQYSVRLEARRLCHWDHSFSRMITPSRRWTRKASSREINGRLLLERCAAPHEETRDRSARL